MPAGNETSGQNASDLAAATNETSNETALEGK